MLLAFSCIASGEKALAFPEQRLNRLPALMIPAHQAVEIREGFVRDRNRQRTANEALGKGDSPRQVCA